MRLFRPLRRTLPQAGEPHLRPLPGPIYGLSAYLDSGTLYVAWTFQPTVADSYNIYRSVNGGAFSLLQDSVTSSPWNDEDGEDNHKGDTLSYIVTGVNETGEGPENTPDDVTLPPPAPTGLAATVASDGSPITLEWDAANGSTSYRWRRAKDGEAYGDPVEVGALLAYDDEDELDGGALYHYQVSAYNAGGWGAWCDEIDVTAPPEAPAKPYVHSWVYDTSTDPDTITVKMRAPLALVAGASHYRAQYRDVSPGEGGAWVTLDESVAATEDVLIPATGNLPPEHRFECRFVAVDSTNTGVEVTGLVQAFTTSISIDPTIPYPAVYGATPGTYPTADDANANTSAAIGSPNGYPTGVDFIQAQVRDLTNNGIWENVGAALGPPIAPATYRTADLTGITGGLQPGIWYQARWVYTYTAASQLFAGYPTNFQIVPPAPDAPDPDVVTDNTADFTVPDPFPTGLINMSLQLRDATGSGPWYFPPGGYLPAAGSVIHLTGLVKGNAYETRWFCASYAGNVLSEVAEWATTGPALPGKPQRVQFDNSYGSNIDVLQPEFWPSDAVTIRLLRTDDDPDDPEAVWTQIASIAEVDWVSLDPIHNTDLTLDTWYWFYWEAVNTAGATATDIAGEKTDPVDPPNLPEAPLAPVVTAKGPTSVELECPAWPVTDPDFPVTRMELFRDDLPGIVLATWEDDTGTFTDEAVLTPGVYNYRLRACNYIGCGPLSEAAVADLASTTLTVTWVSPAEESELSGLVWLHFELEDAGEVDPECSAPNIQVLIDGLPVDGPFDMVGADPCADAEVQARNIEYRVLVDTRLYPQGDVTIRAQAVGTDCMIGYADRAFSIINGIDRGVLFKDFEYPETAPSGYNWIGAVVSLESRELSPSMEQRWWQQWRISTDGSALWAAMEPLTPEEAQAYSESGDRFESRQMRSKKHPFTTAGNRVLWRTRWEPVESLVWFETLSGASAIVKLQTYGAGHLVLARRNDDSAAGIYFYDGTEVTEFYTDGNIRDAAVVGDKVYAILDTAGVGTLRVFDLDSGQVTLDVAIPGETRPMRFVDHVGGKPILLCVNPSLSGERTKAYDLSFPSPTLLWTLEDAVTLTAVDGSSTGYGAANKLYGGGSGTPALAHTFGAEITALEASIAGLANGEIWILDPVDGWGLAASRPDAIAGVTTFVGAAGRERAIAGTSAPALYEQPNVGPAWIVGRTLEPPAELETATIEAVTALSNRLRGSRDILLVGTSPSALLGILERSTLSELDGAFVASDVAYPSIDPIPGEV